LYKHGNGPAVTWSDGKLANEGESIILRDRLGYLVDYVNYNPTLFPKAKSDGVSIEISSPESDNADMSAWQYGCIDGSPGIAGFGIFAARAPVKENGYTFVQGIVHAVLRFTLPEACFVDAALYNVKGDLVACFIHETLRAGYAYSYNIPYRSFAQGMYLFSFRSEHYIFLRKITICNR
jgi:hypothetical protein